MLIQMKQLFNIVGESKDISFEIPISEILTYTSFPFLTPITVYGTLSNRAGIVTLSYKVSVDMHLLCDRCLCEYDRLFEYDFNHIVVQEAQSDNDDFIICKDNELDLSDLAVSDLLLSLPTKNTCAESCKGLCVNCGVDLNKSNCDCTVDD